jgi:REP element-mobilizing transposase RayT
MASTSYSLDQLRRKLLLESIRSVCANRNWDLLAAHIRTDHVHLVVCADASPERVMVDLKTYASRALNAAKLDALGQKRWSRHGSTRYLWNWKSVLAAADYAVYGQGSPMTVFEKSVTEIQPR